MRIQLLLPCILSMVFLVVDVGDAQKKSTAQDIVDNGLHGPEQRAEHVEVVKRMDRNRDGVLKPKEVPGVASSFVQGLAKELGFDPGKPISLEKLHDAHRKDAAKRAAKLHRQRIHVGQVEMLRRMDRNGDGVLRPNEIPRGANRFVASLAKETGSNYKRGIPLNRLAAIHAKRFKKLPDNHHDGTAFAAANAKTISKKDAKQHAQSLTAHLDENGNGVLDNTEWRRLHKEWGKADTDKDENGLLPRRVRERSWFHCMG